MKKIFFYAILSLGVLHVSNAQSLAPASIDLGTVTDTQPDSTLLTLYNPTATAIQVSDILTLPDEYGHQVFTVSQTQFTIPPNDSMKVYVKFAPIHNVAHNSELWVMNNGMRGTLRVDLKGQGHFSIPYYNPTENLSEQALKTQLKTLISTGTTDLGYNGARDQMFMTIDNQKVNGQGATVNTLECVYTGAQITGYVDRAAAQAMNFNTEHTFPQSFFSSNTPMLSDLYHLFPTTNSANSERDNNPFDVLTTGVTWSVGGSKSTGTKFEPRDLQKGKTARAMLYFVTRYQDYTCYLQGQEAVLKQWNLAFPPTIVEKNRNAVINVLQKNRNPFIDYPQFAERISAITTCQTATATPVTSAIIPEMQIDYGNIPLNTPIDYHYWIINSGTTPVMVSNLQTGSSYFTITNGTQTITIPPKEAYEVIVRANVPSVNLYQDDLFFTTNVPNTSTYQIPISANGILSKLEESIDIPLTMVPNPAENSCILTAQIPLGTIELYDAIGRKMEIDIQIQGNTALLHTQTLAQGMYVVKIYSLGGSHFTMRKLWIVR